ncbi:MAG: nitroreductase family protein [Oscillospiraceae bacterium]
MEITAAFNNRRSIYALSSQSSASDERVEEILSDVLLAAPSAFNSQGTRLVLLLGENHKKLWHLVLEALRKVTPAGSFAATEEKVASFAAAHGTILFFEDTQVTQALCDKFPLYKESFPVWALESNGMLTYAVWVRLEAEGLGASLQHYNPLINEAVAKEWNLPAHWQLLGQMPFGVPTEAPGPKETQPVETRLSVFK